MISFLIKYFINKKNKHGTNVLKDSITAINIAWVKHLDLFLMKEHKIHERKKTATRDGNKQECYAK